tara:strand:- start:252 stop:404 length:153 start_codon:yes stop_codon:yes gene_type:complete
VTLAPHAIALAGWLFWLTLLDCSMACGGGLQAADRFSCVMLAPLAIAAAG